MENTKLIELAGKNETAKVVFKSLAERQRDTHVTNLASFRSSLKRDYKVEVDNKDFNNTFIQLQQLGCGEIMYSPRGALQAFRWTLPPSKVGAIASNKPEEVPQYERKIIKTKQGPMTFVLVRSKSNQPIGVTIPGESSDEEVKTTLKDSFNL